MTLRGMLGIQEGLDEKGTIVVAIVPQSADDPTPAPITFVPVTDYTKFVKQFQPADASAAVTTIRIGNEESAVAKKGNFAVIAPPEQEATLKRVIAASKNASISVAPLSGWLGKQDIYGVVLPKGIKQGIKPVRDGLNEAKQQFADNEQFRAIAGMMEMYDGFLATIEKEVTHLGLGMQIDDSGNVFLNSHSLFVANGSLQQAASGAKATNAPPFSQAPAGPYFLAFEGAIPQAWAEVMAKFSAQGLLAMPQQEGQKLSEDDINEFVEAMKVSMSGLKSMTMVMGTMKPGQSMYDNMTAVIKVEDSKKYLANYEKSMARMAKALEKTNNPVFKGYSIERGEIDGITTLDMTMDIGALSQQAGSALRAEDDGDDVWLEREINLARRTGGQLDCGDRLQQGGFSAHVGCRARQGGRAWEGAGSRRSCQAVAEEFAVGGARECWRADRFYEIGRASSRSAGSDAAITRVS